ncbi:hypothetical protein [Dysgonomonas sp.]|uniref:hypothetical protein n=1 Tax=Dysgonomonas sp. TaxID=1891233 RepID=UPI00281D2E50|nr:hypothetical protein [Dysgonomonas sp.]MDR2001682.1 hypothetical protein [Prevotella sp.]HMM04262.1 hypothetical protein [Dysgonomonas sp.]
MRIYLDSCVYQDLKKEENKKLLNSVLVSKQHHIYLFSEAHLYDLSRDVTDEKYIDMDFIESICENNCLLNDSNGARLLTPKEYYNMYDWENLIKSEDIFNSEDPFVKLIMDMFENIPLPFNSIFKPDVFSSKYPKEFVDTMTEPTNIKEYMELMLKTSEQMKEHPFFKGILQGNREVNNTEEFYKTIGIKGFDGENITNKDEFKQSYIRYINKGQELIKNSKTDAYQTFINMYMGLEILNIVKGKPKKQKFTNLMNDSRHAYFGAGCDIVVSKDIDFIEKTKFIYDVFDIHTLILSYEEFKNISYLNDGNNFNEFISEIVNISNYLDNNKFNTNDNKALSIMLSKIYLGYFNILYRVKHDNNCSFIITKKVDEYKNKSLIKEIELITNKLVDSLGEDINNKVYFSRDEIIDGVWNGRTWNFKQIGIYLNFRNIIELIFYKTIDEN